MGRSDYPTARPFLPDDNDLKSLADAAEGCQGCPLYEDATQVVFGQGNDDADLMLVGEQPGAKEDEAGEPFVGPAGQALDKALNRAGIDRGDIYITNAVKHFKHRQTNGKRKGSKPDVSETLACRPWLEQELATVNPRLVIGMGAVAARSLSGRRLAIGEARGEWLETIDGRDLMITYHPSAALRAPSESDREQIFEMLTDDLLRASNILSGIEPGGRPRA